VFLFDRPRQHDDLLPATRHQRKALLRRAHTGQRAQLGTKAPDFDAQSRAMRCIGELRPEGPREERTPRDVSGPRLAKRSCEGEQDGTPGERDHRVCVTHGMAARVHDERPRRQQRRDVIEQEQALLAAHNQPRRRRVQRAGCALDLRRECGDGGVVRGTRGPGQRSARRFRPEASHRDPRNNQLVGGPRRGRKGFGIESRERMLGIVESPDQQKTADLETARMRGVHPITVRVERRARCIERFYGPVQLARDERDLRLRDDAPRAEQRLRWPESARRASQQSLCPNEITESRHGDAAQRKCRRVVAQGDPVQGAERITRGESMRRGGDYPVHRNPATLVTPTMRCAFRNVSRVHQPSLRMANVTNGERQPKERGTMTTHMTGTREEWLAARLELLGAEKELTRRSDEVARQRQELPWVRVDKDYHFETDDGSASLADLFRGRSQLLVYHFMFGPDYTAGCPACSAIADGFDGFVVHLANHDVTLSAVSRAPLAKLLEYERRMGWTFPWASSFGSDFNFDFSVGFTEEQQRKEGIEYNYRREAARKLREGEGTVPAIPSRATPDGATTFAAMSGTDEATYARERPGMSAFVLEDGVVYHAYSTFARGLDGLWGMYQWLDRAPRGRNEKGLWFRRHDEYAKR